MAEDLNGRHALVTGGGSGFGLAIATALADTGARVSIAGIDAAGLADAAARDARLLPVAMDVTDEASVAAGFATARAALGPVTIAVANAGISEAGATRDLALADWRRTMAVNLEGVFLTLRAALPDMEAAGWGRLIGIASAAGLRGLPRAPAYTASKHGVVGLMRCLAEEYTGTGITANALCPGYAETALVDKAARDMGALRGRAPDQIRSGMARANRSGRMITVNEVAATALFLCHPGAESFNGQALPITGGQI